MAVGCLRSLVLSPTKQTSFLLLSFSFEELCALTATRKTCIFTANLRDSRWGVASVWRTKRGPHFVGDKVVVIFIDSVQKSDSFFYGFAFEEILVERGLDRRLGVVENTILFMAAKHEKRKALVGMLDHAVSETVVTAFEVEVVDRELALANVSLQVFHCLLRRLVVLKDPRQVNRCIGVEHLVDPRVIVQRCGHVVRQKEAVAFRKREVGFLQTKIFYQLLHVPGVPRPAGLLYEQERIEDPTDLVVDSLRNQRKLVQEPLVVPVPLLGVCLGVKKKHHLHPAAV
mmetsp:Transcript_21565/g.69443  ORF Transcript_21565/g.69443 Transcript_21565/m.69443 type:complete len:286 (-) Transcript_21565:913-1770(-)